MGNGRRGRGEEEEGSAMGEGTGEGGEAREMGRAGQGAARSAKTLTKVKP
jgi:hypothetical protein